MKKGFVFIETIIVVTILTIALMSIYANYSKIISNTKEFNTFDTAEYNYKTYFLKQSFINGNLKQYNDIAITNDYTSLNKCYIVNSNFSENKIIPSATMNQVKVCLLDNVFYKLNYLENETDENGITYYSYNNNNNLDAYIIDYLNNKDWTANNDKIFLVEYKKEDKQNPGEYFTYISSLNY